MSHVAWVAWARCVASLWAEARARGGDCRRASSGCGNKQLCVSHTPTGSKMRERWSTCSLLVWDTFRDTWLAGASSGYGKQLSTRRQAKHTAAE